MGDDADRAAYVEALRELPARPRRARSATSSGSGSTANPLAGARLQGPRLAGRHRARAADHRVPRRRSARTHFEAVQHGLDRLGITHEIDPRLVRGFDYYTSTTFEFSSQALDAAQNGIGGGGRYDKLAEQMGGKPTPGIGFGIGIERVLIACDAEGVRLGRVPAADVFVVNGMGNATEVDAPRRRAPRERHAGRARLRRPVREGAVEGGRPVGSPVRRDARQREAEHDAVAVKDLQSGDQVEVPATRSSRMVAGTTRDRGPRPMMRTDRAGDLRTTDIGRDVVVCGWVDSRRDHGGVVFLDVRDTRRHRAGRRRSRAAASAPTCTGCATSTSCGSRGSCATGPRARSTTRCPPARSRSAATRARGAERVRDAAVPDRRSHRRRRDAAPPAPLPRPAPPASAAQPAHPRAGERGAAPLARRAGLRRGRDADADRVHARRRARLRRAVAAVAGLVLRAAAEPAVVQAAAHGRRARPLLPDRPLSARRGPARPTGSSSSCSSTPR